MPEVEFFYEGVIDKKFNFKTLIFIPNKLGIDELFGKIISEKDVPFYERDDLLINLKKFVNFMRYEYYKENYKIAIEKFCNSEGDISKIADDWINLYDQNLFRENIENFSQNYPLLSDEEIFADAYSYLVGSPFLETILKLENEYLLQIEAIINQRNIAINGMKIKYQDEMDQALTYNTSEAHGQTKYISSLANKHSEELNLLQSRWDSTLIGAKNLHRKEFREWVMKVYEDDILKPQNGHARSTAPKSCLPPPLSKQRSNPSVVAQTPSHPSDISAEGYRARCSLPNPATSPTNSTTAPDQRPYTKGGGDNCREESFTINLGSQLKLMHNLRLLKRPLVEHFCGRATNATIGTNGSPTLNPVGEVRRGRKISHPRCIISSNGLSPSYGSPLGDGEMKARKMQTLLSLYSDRLSAIIIPEDRSLGDPFSDPTNEIQLLCEKFTEYHFPDLEQQINLVQKEASAIKRTSKGYDLKDAILAPGDVYVTRHSNLSDVQVIFHLCIDDTVRRATQELTSRHSVFSGIRNIFKTCCLFEVATITLPLLLVTELTEEMTINWCHRRAELVFKCVKGFMMEMQSWGCTESKTVQFQLPTKICDEAFDSITAMLPNIFRLPPPISY